MPLPDTINTTYVAGSPPAAKAKDFNDLQLWMKEAWAIIRHASYSFIEEFDGTDLSASPGSSSYKSAKFDSAGGAGTEFLLVDDTAQKCNGAVQFNHAATKANSLLSNASLLAFGQSDLYLTCRLRIPSIGGANSQVLFGLNPQFTGPNLLEMVFNPTANGNSNWWLWYGATGSPTKVDTGVACGTTNQQIVDVVRTSGIITVAFDNADPVVTVGPSPFNLDQVWHMINCNASTSGTTNCIVDYYKCWARTSR